MKTTNLKQTSVAKPRKWFQRRRRWHDPREARAERSQFRDQPPSREATRATGGCVYIFVNSRRIREFLPRLRPAQIELQNFSSLVNQVLKAPLAFDVLILGQRKAIQDYETDTRNIAARRSGVSIDALDSGLARSTVRSN